MKGRPRVMALSSVCGRSALSTRSGCSTSYLISGRESLRSMVRLCELKFQANTCIMRLSTCFLRILTEHKNGFSAVVVCRVTEAFFTLYCPRRRVKCEPINLLFWVEGITLFLDTGVLLATLTGLNRLCRCPRWRFQRRGRFCKGRRYLNELVHAGGHDSSNNRPIIEDEGTCALSASLNNTVLTETHCAAKKISTCNIVLH